MKLRKLNELGLKRFREFLEEARTGGSRAKNAPLILLELPMTSEDIIGAPELKSFTHAVSSFELAGYLHGQFAQLDAAVIEGTDGYGDPGFWAAVSLFYFDLLSPGYREDGHRILTDNREKMDEIATILLEKETLTADEFMALLSGDLTVDDIRRNMVAPPPPPNIEDKPPMITPPVEEPRIQARLRPEPA